MFNEIFLLFHSSHVIIGVKDKTLEKQMEKAKSHIFALESKMVSLTLHRGLLAF